MAEGGVELRVTVDTLDFRLQVGRIQRRLALLRPRPFDWATDCPGDVERTFPPIVGRGRGEVIGQHVYLRMP